MDKNYNHHLMSKVTVFRKSQSGENLIEECMFDSAVLAQIFVKACEAEGITAGLN